MANLRTPLVRREAKRLPSMRREAKRLPLHNRLIARQRQWEGLQIVLLALIVLGQFLLTGCSNTPTAVPITPTSTLVPTPTPIPPPPAPDTTASAFLDAWETGDYEAMYARLSPASQAAIDAESFVQRYQNALTTATALTVSHRLQSALQEDNQARVSFELQLDTALVGTLITETVMSLSMDGGQWWVDWDEGLIWPQLREGRYFRMEYIIPARANIYDRAGLGLATEGTIVTIGVIPGQITDETALLDAVASVTDLSPEEIRGRYIAAPADWKVPIADIPAETSVEQNELFSSIPGIYREEKEGRTYPHGTVQSEGKRSDYVAPHVIGWVAPVPAEQLEAYRARGYRGDEWVGVSGLEAWGEDILAGLHGGVLTVVTPAGEEIATAAERPAIPSRTIYTTFDRGFQEQVQQILGGRKGAIVVLDVRTGAVRALSSGPGFDPNVFVGPAGEVGRAQILADPRRPLFNRATQGTYPSASVFKIVTMSAAMEEGGMDPEKTFLLPRVLGGTGAGLPQDVLGNQWARRHQPEGWPDSLVRRRVLHGRTDTRRSKLRCDPPVRAGFRFRRADRTGRSARGERAGARSRLEGRGNRGELVGGRHGQPGHRPGLPAGDAAAGGAYDRRRRQRRHAVPSVHHRAHRSGRGGDPRTGHPAPGRRYAAHQPRAPGEHPGGDVGRDHQIHRDCGTSLRGLEHPRRGQDRHGRGRGSGFCAPLLVCRLCPGRQP